MAYIEWKDLEKYYGENHVLQKIEGTIEKGELVTLLGPSGCGKSTLLRCIAGLEEVSGGQIFLKGTDITHMPPQKRDMGMVFQQYSLFPNMTVEQNVGFRLKMKRIPAKERTPIVEEMLERVGLRNCGKSYPNQLSGGQQQRVALARAMVWEPKVLLLDEPLSALDAMLRKNLQTEIRRIQKVSGITTIFVTHDQNEAMVISDRIVLMNDGRIEQQGRPEEIYSRPQTCFVAGFMGSYNIIPAEVFSYMTGKEVAATSVAIRPEIIRVQSGGNDCDEYHIKGILQQKELHGNILRLHLISEGYPIHVDVLYDGSCVLEEGQEYAMAMKKSDCLCFPV